MSLIEWLLLLMLFVNLGLFAFLGTIVFAIIILYLDRLIRDKKRAEEK